MITQSEKCLVDLGSGAGFPGLVVALLAGDNKRDLTVHLVESDTRKAAFLTEIAGQLDLLGRKVFVHPLRAELVARSLAERADCVTARAVAPLGELLELATPFLARDGHALFLKGNNAEDEIGDAESQGWQFTCARHPSRSDPAGVILDLHSIARGPAVAGATKRKL
jgi:16S rRNA (guanine527-N7)-methyltransferase